MKYPALTSLAALALVTSTPASAQSASEACSAAQETIQGFLGEGETRKATADALNAIATVLGRADLSEGTCRSIAANAEEVIGIETRYRERMEGEAPEGEAAAEGEAPEGEAAAEGEAPEGEAAAEGEAPEGEASAEGEAPEGEASAESEAPEGEAAAAGTEAEGGEAAEGEAAEGEQATEESAEASGEEAPASEESAETEESDESAEGSAEGTAAAAGAAAGAAAAAGGSEAESSEAASGEAAEGEGGLDGMTVESLVGREVYGGDAAVLGEVDRVVMSGDAPHLIVSYGGFLGFGKTEVGVPASEFQAGSGENLILPGATEESFGQLEEWADDEAEEMEDDATIGGAPAEAEGEAEKQEH